MIKLAVVGSRNFKNLDLVNEHLNYFKINYGISEIITGGARGVDSTAIVWAKNNECDINDIRPLFYKPKFYLYRNIEIITLADYVLIFWDYKSTGTGFVKFYCEKRGIKFSLIGDENI